MTHDQRPSPFRRTRRREEARLRRRCVQTLQHPPRATAALQWTPLPTDRWPTLAAASGATGLPRRAAAAGREGADGAQRILLAPPWLISADNALGHRYKHWLYGATPPPCVMLHFVCVATGEASRILPMRLFGRWHEAAVQAEQNVLDVLRTSPADLPRLRDTLRRGAPLPPLEAPAWSDLRRRLADNASQLGRLARASRGGGFELPGSAAPSAPGRRRLLALEPGTLEEPLRPRPWPELNALHAEVRRCRGEHGDEQREDAVDVVEARDDKDAREDQELQQREAADCRHRHRARRAERVGDEGQAAREAARLVSDEEEQPVVKGVARKRGDAHVQEEAVERGNRNDADDLDGAKGGADEHGLREV